jgi:hypothetical protein
MVEKPFESKTTAARAGAPAVSARKLLSGKAGVKRRSWSETVTLVYAASAAVALGVACGAWINARLASAASIARPAPARLLPVASANAPKTAEPSAVTDAVTEPRLNDHDDTASAADQLTPSHGLGESPDAGTPRTDPAGATDKLSMVKRGVVVPDAGEASRPVRDNERHAVAPDVGKRATAAPTRAMPCALYASAGSLTIRNGGAATLVVGGPGEAGRVNVSTPDWSDIAVFSEGRTGGNGWMRYSVKSVSKKPGVYTARFTTPCGSRTVQVTVTRP